MSATSDTHLLQSPNVHLNNGNDENINVIESILEPPILLDDINEELNEKEIEMIYSYSTPEELERYRKLKEGDNDNNDIKVNNNNNNNSENQNDNIVDVKEEKQKEDKEKEISWKKTSLNSSSVGSLLRFFQSQFFDTWISVSYLYRYPSPGIHDYLCNALYSFPDDEIEFYLVQLCTMLIHADFESNALERFILDKCKQSIHLALQVSWLLQSSSQDSPHKRDRCETLLNLCETSVVNSSQEQLIGRVIYSLLGLNHSTESASTLSMMENEGTLTKLSPKQRNRSNSVHRRAQSMHEIGDASFINDALQKKERCDYFNQILTFVEDLNSISSRLRSIPIPERADKLKSEMSKINQNLPVGLYLPLWNASQPHYTILRLLPEESKVLNSKERVPYIVVFEILKSDAQSSARDLQQVAQSYASIITNVENNPNVISNDNQPEISNFSDSPFGYPFEKKKEYFRKISPFGRFDSWDLKSVIVKYGDDCRQEFLAMQLINQFKRIFDDANLPIYLHPFRILVSSPSSGLIETITNAISLHQLKKFYLPETVSLRSHFDRYYKDAEDHKVAIQNFVESLAGYSLLCYILQIKDRHNGNIMITNDGHIVHIDFGFMISNYPGGLNSENVPFKFTHEYLSVMGDFSSPMYQYFKALLLKGFIELRKYCEKIVLLVEMIAIGSKLPCFKGGQDALTALRERFHLGLPEKQIAEIIEYLIHTSYNNWKSHFYDRFQYVTNGILY